MPSFDPDKEKIVIDIIKEEDKPKAEPPKEEELGMLPTPQYPRRTFRRPEEEDEDENIYIRFYDGGYSASGEDLDFVLLDPPAIVVGTPPPGLPATHKPFSLSSVDYLPPFNAAMIALAGSFQSSQAEVMPDAIFDLYGFNPHGITSGYVPDKGYIYTGSGRLNCTNKLPAFRVFDTDDTGHYKITTTPDIGGDEVAFTVTEDCKVLLVPPVFRYVGRAYVKETFGSTSPGDTYLPNGFYKAYSREFGLVNPTFEALFGLPMFRRKVVENIFVASPNPPASLPIRNFFHNWLCGSDPNAHCYKVKSFISFFSSWYISHTSTPPPTFPRYENPLLYVDSPNFDYPRVQVTDAGFNSGLLLAVIVQGGTTYYVWNRGNFVLNSVGQWVNIRV